MAETCGRLKLSEEAYREIDEAVAYMEDSIAREKLVPESGCPNRADELKYEDFESAAFALADHLAAAIGRMYAN
jgi:hypothetical protein